MLLLESVRRAAGTPRHRPLRPVPRPTDGRGWGWSVGAGLARCRAPCRGEKSPPVAVVVGPEGRGGSGADTELCRAPLSAINAHRGVRLVDGGRGWGGVGFRWTFS